MKNILFAALMLSSAAANAQVYKCPEVYPSKNAPTARLTNAMMYFGERNGSGAMHGDIEEVKEGTDIHYGFPDQTPKWLVCQYGGKRISGTSIAGAQVVGGREWWMQLDQQVDVCDLKIREVKSRERGESTWTATATCKGKILPPPLMYEKA